jgi:hypothetical protein
VEGRQSCRGRVEFGLTHPTGDKQITTTGTQTENKFPLDPCHAVRQPLDGTTFAIEPWVERLLSAHEPVAGKQPISSSFMLPSHQYQLAKS